MRESYYIELLAGIEAGITGVLIALLHKWYLAFLVGFFGFVLFSFLISKLKEETLKEYLKAVKEAKTKDKERRIAKEIVNNALLGVKNV